MDAPSIVKFDKEEDWILLHLCAVTKFKDMPVYTPF